MAVHTEIVPSGDPALGIGLEALRLARMRMTSNAGSSYWPMGDGTGILAGQQAGDQGLVLVDQHGNRMPLIDTTEISQKADDAISKANAAVDGMEQVREDAENGVKEAKDAAANADSKAQSAIDGMQSVRNEAVKGVKEAKDAASTAQSTAASAASKADKLATELDGTKLGEVETKVSNSVEHADQALSASTQAVQTANSVKTTADRAYDDAQSALTQSSTAVQTAGEVKTTLETNYLSKKDSDAAYASKSELKQTSDGITSTVEKTYATKSALEALRNIADNAVETWTGSQKPTASNAPASTWATDQLRKQHAGDVYYDTSTGYSYRWGSTDGETYAWSLIKDSDITKAIADAAKAQSTANGAQKGVDRLDADIPVTYSTKSELRQTSESLTAKVTEAQRVGQSALDKATTVEQTANGLKTTVQEQAQTIKGQTTTIGQLTQKADSLTSSLTQTNQNVETAQSTADTAISRASKLEQTLDGFKTSVSQTYETKADSLKKQSALEQNLNGFKTSVSNTYLSKTDASKTYSTKSELTQTNESLTAKINSTATTANNALSKAASVEATANGLKTTVSEQATTLKGHTSTIGQLTAKADSLTSSLTQTNRNVETALANGAELIRNPECDRTLGNPDGWTNGLTLSASGAPEGAPAPTYGKLSARDTTNGSKVLRRGRTYRFSAWMAHDSTAKKPAALGCFYHESNGNGHWDTAFRVPTSQSGWKQWSGDLTIPKAAREDAIVWLQVGGANGSADVTGWYCTLLSIRDVTEAKNAQTTADTAISRASTLEQSLNGFKTTVSQNYETKSDSLAKKTALEQSLNGFKTSVSNTYLSKTDASKTYATKSSVEQTATSIKSSVSETYATKTTVQNLSTTVTQTKESLTVSIKQAQTTANTANGNATNAQSRVGSLEACIRMTSSGVRVGQIKNGSFVGYSALVSTSGSFQVIDNIGNKVSELNAGSVLSYDNGRTVWSIKQEGQTVTLDSYASPLKLASSDLYFLHYPKYSSNNHLACPVSGQFKGATNVNGVAVITHNLGYIPTLSITPGPWDGIGEPQGKLFRPVIWDCTTTTAQIRFVRTDTNQWIDRQPVAFHWYAI